MGDINRQMGIGRGADRVARASTIFRVILEKTSIKKSKGVGESVDKRNWKE